MSTYPSGYTASTFKSALFDNNSTMDTSLGTLDFLNFGSFDCRYYASNGNLVGQLKWQSGNPGTLTIAGTIWIDGNLGFAGNELRHRPGPGDDLRHRHDLVQRPGEHLRDADLGKPLPRQLRRRTRTCSCSSRTTTAAHATTGSRSRARTRSRGSRSRTGSSTKAGTRPSTAPVLADTANMAGNGDTRTIINPPAGAPGAAYDETITDVRARTRPPWTDVPGSWQQLR